MLNESGSGLSIADAMALKDNNNGGFFGGDGSWIFFLFFLLAWGNGGWGGFGNRGGSGSGDCGCGGITPVVVPYGVGGSNEMRANIYDGFATQNIQSGITSLANGLCDGFYALNTSVMQGTNAIQSDLNTGFAGVSNALCQGFNGVNATINAGTNNITGQICDLGYALKDCCCNTQAAIKDCCCQTQRSIDGVNYNMAKNTCDIMTASAMNTRDIIDSQNAGFQRIVDFLTEDKIDSLRTELQAAQLQLGNLSQTNTIINTLRPIPQPAYLTCSPYASATHVGVGYYGNNGCGGCCGC